MCGILGIVAPPGRTIDTPESQIIAMRDVMTSRGPDGAGFFRNRNVVFAHRLLAIRDRQGGAQPLCSDDGRYVLVYNGELYNNEELRAQLTAAGFRFRTNCDTETLLAAFMHWGSECVRRLRGMFAFVVYDFNEDRLLMARDRFGIKPLFVTQFGECLGFASSIAALVRHPDFERLPNFRTISHYLSTFRITLGSETLFEGIWQLNPGEILQWHRGEVAVSRYWDYPLDETCDVTYSEAVSDLHSQLKKSVASQLVGDVPVGMLMSGGVDSNTLACLLRQERSGAFLGYCGGGNEGAVDDFQHARQCADYVGFDYDEIRVSPGDYLDCWQDLVDRSAQPLSTPTDVVLHQLASTMKRHVGVVLGGEGADELLCGYAVQHWAGQDFDLQQRLSSGHWEGTSAAARLFRRSLRRQYGRDQFASPVDHYFALNSLIPTSAKSALFEKWAWNAADRDRSMRDVYGRLFTIASGVSTIRQHATVLHRVNLEGLLARLDHATMSTGLEARVPYTDHEMVERMFRLPDRFKIDIATHEQATYLASAQLDERGSLRSKRMLRTVAQQLMPSGLAQRKKASFPTPVQTWLSGPWSDWSRHRILESPFGRAIFQKTARQELAGNVTQAGMWLWPILNLLAWGDRHFGGF